MLPVRKWSVVFTLLMLIFGTRLALSQDSEQGATLFQQQCSGCHSVEPGSMLVGPSLWGVIGREAGASADANYSTALEEADIVWDSDTLDAYLAAPSEYLPGTDKVVAVPDQQQRGDLIAYLQTLTDQ